MTDPELDRLFGQARTSRTELPDHVRARALADAARLVPGQFAVGPVRSRPLWRWIESLAWPAGLASACLAGLFAGQSPMVYARLMAAGVFDTELSYQMTYHLPALAGLIGGY